MPRGKVLPHKGRPQIFITFGEPMIPEDGETTLQFSDRISKEVRGLVDYTMAYRADHA
jgi:1-acyl-sn-glycerol-3-phosphate acyltransferase